MVAQLAAGTLGTKDIADWLAPRLRPSGRAATPVKEAPMRERPALPLAVGRPPSAEHMKARAAAIDAVVDEWLGRDDHEM
jgi:hypothetical protein